MELKVDLLKEKKQKSLLRVVLGISFFLIGVSWIANRLIGGEIIRFFDWFYCGAFILNAIFHFIEGLGHSVDSFFGEASIQINSDIISLKSNILVKEQRIHWSEIKSIEYKPDIFKIKKIDGSIQNLTLSKFGFMQTEEITNIINCIAKEKSIEIL